MQGTMLSNVCFAWIEFRPRSFHFDLKLCFHIGAVMHHSITTHHVKKLQGKYFLYLYFLDKYDQLHLKEAVIVHSRFIKKKNQT